MVLENLEGFCRLFCFNTHSLNGYIFRILPVQDRHFHDNHVYEEQGDSLDKEVDDEKDNKFMQLLLIEIEACQVKRYERNQATDDGWIKGEVGD